jgi:hypothetical protein
VFLVSCSEGEFGAQLEGIGSAREKYEELESARVTVTDSFTGRVIEDFRFRYEGDTLTYLYWATDGETVYAEYNNGSRLCYGYGGEADWTALTVSDDGFYSYGRGIKHRLTKKSLFFLDAPSVSSVDFRDGNGVAVEYDVKKLNKRSDKEKFSELTTEFRLDKSGYIEVFIREHTLSDGGEFAYKIEITDMNAAGVIERPDFSEALQSR